MKVVIDIPKEHYEYIQNLPHYKRNYAEDLILDGTPLPKGRGDLIDKNELIKRYEKDCGRRIYADNFIFDLENNTTTIIEAESEEKNE